MPQHLKHCLEWIGMGGLETVDVIVALSNGHLAIETV